MATTKDCLFLALEKAQEEMGRTRKARLPKQIGALLNQFYPSKETRKQVQEIVARKSQRRIPSGAASGMKRWTPPKKGGVQKEAPVDHQIVVKKPDNYAKYIDMDHKTLINEFGSAKALKAFSKELGLKVDTRMSAEKFVVEFQAALRVAEGQGPAPTEEELKAQQILDDDAALEAEIKAEEAAEKTEGKTQSLEDAIKEENTEEK